MRETAESGRVVARQQQRQQQRQRWLRLLVAVAVLVGATVTGTGAASAFAFSDDSYVLRSFAVRTPSPNPMPSGSTLLSGHRMESLNGYRLTMQTDGNLVVSAPDSTTVLWHSSTAGNFGATARLQDDGNLVVVGADRVSVLWTAATSTPGAELHIQDDGNLVIYAQGRAVWSSQDRPAAPPSRDLVHWGRQMEAMGYVVSEHPAFGGVCSCHSGQSRHYRGGAIDVNWRGPGSEEQRLDELHAWIVENIPSSDELLWRVPGHTNHLHLAI